MLYVFMVNTGSMLTLDMVLTMQSVQRLQEALAAQYQLPIEKQVLLISGGQSLDPQIRVCSYSAGTDTNPIFLFSKGTIESASLPVTSSMLQSNEEKVRLQVEGLKNLPHSYSAVVARTQLALQFHDFAKENLRLCEGLVHDQHLQQQGWMAVVANLEDITSAFTQRAAAYKQNTTEFLSERPLLATQLTEFSDVLHLLTKTPLLPCLLRSEGSKEAAAAAPPEDASLSLMQWISSQDQRSTLQQMAQQCTKSLEQFTPQVLGAMSTEINTTMDAVNNSSMKEVKGLGERLFGLEQLLTNAQKLLLEQAEMAQGMVQNQTRASNLNDSSVLPDLCTSHQQQLALMFKKHCQLAEISRRCRVAKEELCHNLHVRLRWIMYIEQQISAVHSKMLVYHENLRRLRKRLEIVRQVYSAPQLYATAVVEVCRRRRHASQFTAWAERICERSLTSHEMELAKRKEFASQMERHFLGVLFPGLIGEEPPMFATIPPGSFDTRLPNITGDDVDILRRQLPELAHILSLPAVDNDMAHDKSAIAAGTSKASLSDTHTQTSISSYRDVGDLRSTESDVIVLETKPLDWSKSVIIEPSSPPPSRPDSLPECNRLSSVDSLPGGVPFPVVSPSSPEQSPSLQNIDYFVSATASPEFNLAPLDLSTRSETPFASLLMAPEGNFYSAVTSPLGDAESPPRELADAGSVAKLVKESHVLKETLRETETLLEDSELRFDEAQVHLKEQQTELSLAKDEKTLVEDKLATTKGKIASFAQRSQMSLSVLRKDWSDVRTEVCEHRAVIGETFSFLFLKVAVYSDLVKKSELVHSQLEDEAKRLRTAKEGLNIVVNSLQGELQKSQNALREKKGEFVDLRESNRQDLEELTSRMEQERREELASLRNTKEAEVRELLTILKELEGSTAMMKETTEAEIKMIKESLSGEKLECLEALRTELMEKHARELEAQQHLLQDTHLKELDDFGRATELKVDVACSDLKDALDKNREDDLRALRTGMVDKHKQDLATLSESFTKAFTDLKKAHQNIREDIQREWTNMLTRNEELVASTNLRIEEVVSVIAEKPSVASLSSGLESSQHAGVSNLEMRKSNLDKEVVVMLAEKQQTFNVAVSRVAATKDKTIEDLKKKMNDMREQQRQSQDLIEKLLMDKDAPDTELTLTLQQARQSERQLVDFVDQRDCQIAMLQQKLHTAGECHTCGPAQLLVPNERDTMSAASASEERLQALLRSKELECTALKHQVLQLRVSPVSNNRAEKISIIDIIVGDLVLIFFEEPRDNYVVFSIEPTLYFVHSESLSGLDLKQSGSTGPKRQWIIGRVTDKEYCQAKKANNRFKVAIGTKFYRVKAKKYDMKQGEAK